MTSAFMWPGRYMHLNKYTFLKWGHIAEYFFTPEDSEDTVYHEPDTHHPEDLPVHARIEKTIFWIVTALLLAFLLAKLQ